MHMKNRSLESLTSVQNIHHQPSQNSRQRGIGKEIKANGSYRRFCCCLRDEYIVSSRNALFLVVLGLINRAGIQRSTEREREGERVRERESERERVRESVCVRERVRERGKRERERDAALN